MSNLTITTQPQQPVAPRRQFRVRPWNEATHDDAPVYEVVIVGGVKKCRRVPGECCFTIVKTSNFDHAYGSIDWLPASLRPIVDSDEWAEQALPYIRRARKKVAKFKWWRS